MVKRYIQSYISMKYVFVLPALAMGVFVCAFLYTSTGNDLMRWIGGAFGLVLAGIMVFYYREKFLVYRQLKQIKDLDSFNSAVMIGQAFFLEKRMLGYHTCKVYDLRYPDIRTVTFREGSHGKLFLDLETSQGTLPVEMALKNQAQRVAKFLCTKNSAVTVNGIEPAGEGTLHSIDPYRDEKA